MIPAVPSPTNRAAQLSATWPSPRGSADRLLADLIGAVQHLGITEIHI
jgi:hypothetical protein